MAALTDASLIIRRHGEDSVKIVFDSNPNDNYWIVSDRVISKLNTLF